MKRDEFREKKKWLEIIILHGQNWMRSGWWRTHPEGSYKWKTLSFTKSHLTMLTRFSNRQWDVTKDAVHARFQLAIYIWSKDIHLIPGATPASPLPPLGTTFRRKCDIGHQHGKENKPHCWTSNQNIILLRMWASSSCRLRAAAGKESVEIIIKALARAPRMKWLSCVIC